MNRAEAEEAAARVVRRHFILKGTSDLLVDSVKTATASGVASEVLDAISYDSLLDQVERYRAALEKIQDHLKGFARLDCHERDMYDFVGAALTDSEVSDG